MRKFYLFIVAFLIFAPSQSQTLIAGWTFDATAGTPNTPKTVAANLGVYSSVSNLFANGTNGSSNWNQATELDAFAGNTANDPRATTSAGNTYSLLGGTSNSANNKAIVFQTSTAGYKNIRISFATRGTGTGFSSHQWAYSTDGTNFTNFGSNTANTTTTFLSRTLDLTAVPEVNNASTLYLRLTVNGASSASGNNRIDNLQVTSDNYTWFGATSDDFTVASNWIASGLRAAYSTAPGSGDDINFQGSPVNSPTIGSATTVGNVTYLAGVSGLTIGGSNTFTVNGEIANNSSNIQTLIPTVRLAGSAAQTILGTSGFTFGSLTIDNSNGATLAALCNITNTLTVSSGQLTTGGNLILKSSISATANVAPMIGSISGNVTVERFIPAKRAWRLLSSAVSGTTINAAWQEGKNNNVDADQTGYGTHITGGATGDGFDLSSTNGASLKTWNQAGQNWVNATATNTGTITDHSGYIIFIRGDRSLNITGVQPAANNTILRTTGTLRQGNFTNYVTTSATSTHYTLMGNPYASPIDLGLLVKDTDNGYFDGPDVDLIPDQPLLKTFYSWDPTLTGLNGVGGYVLMQTTDGDTWEYTPHGGAQTGNNNARFVPSGAAVFVKSPGSAQAITMKESYKTTGTTNLTYFRTANANTNLAINLNNSSSDIIDGIRVKFDDNYSNDVTAEDANKLNNENENIAIRRNNQSLIVEKRGWINQDDTLFIRLSGMKQNTAYELKFFPSNFAGINAFLEDAYLNTSTPVSLTAETVLNFNTDANVASVGDRFRIVFRPSSVMPVSFTGIRAQKQNDDVLLEWTVTNEVNTANYVVERSQDGRTFTAVASVPVSAMATGEKKYQWLDVNAVKGSNYYRIKSVGTSNDIKYTSVVKVTFGNADGDINVYPNPVRNGQVSLQFNDLAQGNYEVNVFSASGQRIMSKRIVHGGGSSVEEMVLPKGTSKGIYRLQLAGNETRIVKTIIVE